MLLSQLRKGDKAEVIKVVADRALRDRFCSFGIMPGEELEIKACSMAKQTVEIAIGSTMVALRIEEAEKIVVDKKE